MLFLKLGPSTIKAQNIMFASGVNFKIFYSKQAYFCDGFPARVLVSLRLSLNLN